MVDEQLNNELKGGEHSQTEEFVCDYCIILEQMIKNKDVPFDKKSVIILEGYLERINERKHILGGYVRGFALCPICYTTFKKDNKFRLNNHLEIPTTLETLRLQSGEW
jgi:protein-arginine kinase activator protein McsA